MGKKKQSVPDFSGMQHLRRVTITREGSEPKLDAQGYPIWEPLPEAFDAVLHDAATGETRKVRMRQIRVKESGR